MSNLLIIIITAFISVAVTAVVAYFINNTIKKNKASRIIKDAETEAENIKKEKILQAKEKFLQLKTDHERHINEKNSQIQQQENKLKQREMQLNQQNQELQKQPLVFD
jgi:ribonuclease Y